MRRENQKSMPKRPGVLLLISMYFLPEPGGGSLAAYHRAISLKKIGYKVFVLTAFPNYPTGRVNDPKYKGKSFLVEDFEDITIIRIKLLALKHAGYLRRLTLYMNFVFSTVLLYLYIKKYTGKIDIVYARAPIIFSSFNGYIISKFSKSLFVYEVPDLWPEELVLIGSSVYRLILPIGKLLAKLSYLLPSKIITVSNLAKKIICETYAPSAPVYSVPTGVDPEKYPKLPKYECREKLIETGIFPKELRGKFIILYAGIISNAQRVENLFPIAKSLEKDCEIAFVIIGEGDKRSFIEKLAKQHENIYLLPYQPRHLMPLIVYSADVCSVLLSDEPIFDIAFPTKFYESLACNKPILGICRGELASVIESNKIGIAAKSSQIQEFADFINRLKNSEQFFKAIEKNVSDALQLYTLDTIAVNFKSIIDCEND